MNYKLLALDLDGTTLGPNLNIDPAVSKAIAAAQAQGVRVTIATGRMFGSTVPYARQLNIHDPVICYQGALIRDPNTGEIFQHVVTPGDLAAEAIEMLRERDIFTIAYIDERLCASERRRELDEYLQWHPEGIEVVIDPELAALGISKGSALAALAARLGIAREQVIAIGDHENDLPMIEWAGLGLAMGNAIPAAHAIADAVLPSVEQAGVAWAIEHYILSS
jgi:hydroxymethylpyrimidine pyrophosphatase-like HAD family hydrolase